MWSATKILLYNKKQTLEACYSSKKTLEASNINIERIKDVHIFEEKNLQNNKYLQSRKPNRLEKIWKTKHKWNEKNIEN